MNIQQRRGGGFALLFLPILLCACGDAADSEPASSTGMPSGTETPQPAPYIAVDVVGATMFLRNRDWFETIGAVSAIGDCLLSGSYEVTGSQEGSCSTQGGQVTFDVTWMLTACKHVESDAELTFTGEVHQVGSLLFDAAPDCISDNDYGTWTALGLRIAGTTPKGDVDDTCDVELDHADGRLTGTVCGESVSLD